MYSSKYTGVKHSPRPPLNHANAGHPHHRFTLPLEDLAFLRQLIQQLQQKATHPQQATIAAAAVNATTAVHVNATTAATDNATTTAPVKATKVATTPAAKTKPPRLTVG